MAARLPRFPDHPVDLTFLESFPTAFHVVHDFQRFVRFHDLSDGVLDGHHNGFYERRQVERDEALGSRVQPKWAAIAWKHGQ